MDKEAQREAYVAHINENGAEQSVRDHLYGTAKRAAAFAAVFQGEKHAEVIGLMHDIGKYSEGFQNRIRNQGKIVDHSTAGAVERIEKKISSELCVSQGITVGYRTAEHFRIPVMRLHCMDESSARRQESWATILNITKKFRQKTYLKRKWGFFLRIRKDSLEPIFIRNFYFLR